jgi:hypothetical protein
MPPDQRPLYPNSQLGSFHMTRTAQFKPGSSLKRYAHTFRNIRNMALEGGGKRVVNNCENANAGMACLETIESTSAIIIEVLAAIPARLAFRSPRRLPILYASGLAIAEQGGIKAYTPHGSSDSQCERRLKGRRCGN